MQTDWDNNNSYSIVQNEFLIRLVQKTHFIDRSLTLRWMLLLGLRATPKPNLRGTYTKLIMTTVQQYSSGTSE